MDVLFYPMHHVFHEVLPLLVRFEGLLLDVLLFDLRRLGLPSLVLGSIEPLILRLLVDLGFVLKPLILESLALA